MDLSNVLGLIGGAMGSNAQYKQQLTSASGTMKEGLAIESEAATRIAELQGVQQVQAYQGDLQAQENARRAATVMGTNMDAETEIMSMLASRMRASAINASNKAQKVAKMEASSNFGNPFGLLYDLLYGDGDRAEADAAKKEFETHSGLMNQLNQSTTISAQTQKAIAETKSAAGLLAEQEMVALSTDKIRGELMRTLAGVDINMLNNLSSLDAQGVQLAMGAYNVQAQAEQRAFARQEAKQNRELRAIQIDQAKESRELTIIQKRMMIAEAQDKAEGRDNLIADLAAGIKATGAQISAPSTWPEAQRILTANKEVAERLASIGAQQRVAGSHALGATPRDAIATAEILRLPMTGTAANVKTNLAVAGAEATKPDALQRSGVKPQDVADVMKDKALMAQTSNRAMIQKAITDAELIKPADKTNIYSMPNLDTFLDNPYMQSNAWLASTIAPVAAAGGAEFNPDQLLELGAKALLDGTSTTKEVTDGITWLAAMGILTNNSMNNYQKNFAVPNQTSANMHVKAGTGISSLYTDTTRKINLADPTQVTRALVDKLSRERVLQGKQNFRQGLSFLGILSDNTADLGD